ncbi:hypothetical protein ARMGADRAFT_1110802 [Armillaria gallica]|uniref:Uncharacterized protein n=1 Tax=Armillaria gallica TaxID=47427 RepID=A0A2H3D6N0_ARMGA|nr:hypothetical protein ARMGADRAFT_1110802 [Armillaria gallica]
MRASGGWEVLNLTLSRGQKCYEDHTLGGHCVSLPRGWKTLNGNIQVKAEHSCVLVPNTLDGGVMVPIITKETMSIYKGCSAWYATFNAGFVQLCMTLMLVGQESWLLFKKRARRVRVSLVTIGTGHLPARWMRFLFGRDGIISLVNLRELVFPVLSEVDSWMPGVHEFFGRAPRLERAMLLDWRGSHQNFDYVTPVPDISCLHYPTVFVPLAYTDRYEVRRALVPKKTKVNAVDTAISMLDWTRRMVDTSSRLEVVLIMNATSVVDGKGIQVA